MIPEKCKQVYLSTCQIVLKIIKRYIHILNGILDLVWPKQMRSTLEQ